MTNVEKMKEMGGFEDILEEHSEESINSWSAKDVLNAWLEWEGIIGYTTSIVNIYEALRKGNEPECDQPSGIYGEDYGEFMGACDICAFKVECEEKSNHHFKEFVKEIKPLPEDPDVAEYELCRGDIITADFVEYERRVAGDLIDFDLPTEKKPSMFRNLSPKEEKEFREWPRENYKPWAVIDPMWHPVIQDECNKINQENFDSYESN